MAEFRCKMCCAPLPPSNGKSVVQCEYCFSMQTIATDDDEKTKALYNRANDLRSACDFDQAALFYQSVIVANPKEAEAYWGLCLCKFGIEYVTDPISKKKIPTVHRASFDSVLKDPDYLLALEYADVLAKKEYEAEAKAIEKIRLGIMKVSQKEEPYDVFICYKETDEDNSRTIDSVIAEDIHDRLEQEGYKVFFARISLEDKLGSMYEPYIFAALHSAKVMLVVGTKPEYFDAVWVKNEWTRYLDLMGKDKNKFIVPCYRDIDAYDLPERLRQFQSQDVSKIGYMQDLLRGIKKLIGTKAAKEETAAKESRYTRAYILLEEGDFAGADKVVERKLDDEPKSSELYLLKALIEEKYRDVNEFKTKATKETLLKPNFKRALEYAEGKEKKALEAIIAAVNERLENEANEVIYQEALRLKKLRRYDEAIDAFNKLGDYKKKAEKLAECHYLWACDLENSDFSYDGAIEHFALAGSYEDAKQRLEVCREKKRQQEEQMRIDKIVDSYSDWYVKLCLGGIWSDDITNARTKEQIEARVKKLEQYQGNSNADRYLKGYRDALKKYEAKKEAERLAEEKRQETQRKQHAKMAHIACGKYSFASIENIDQYHKANDALNALEKYKDVEEANALIQQIRTLMDRYLKVEEEKKAQAAAAAKAANEKLKEASENIDSIKEEAKTVEKEIEKLNKKRTELLAEIAKEENVVAAVKEPVLGSSVAFGSAALFGVKGALLWEIIDKSDFDSSNGGYRSVLLLSKQTVARKPFDEGKMFGLLRTNNYYGSSLRDWLIHDFFNKAFTQEQKARLLLKPFKEEGGKDTGKELDDPIFLLSSSQFSNCVNDVDYYDSMSISKNVSEDVEAKCERGKRGGPWWLRSQNSKVKGNVASVIATGVASPEGVLPKQELGVVPAIWMKYPFPGMEEAAVLSKERLIGLSDELKEIKSKLEEAKNRLSPLMDSLKSFDSLNAKTKLHALFKDIEKGKKIHFGSYRGRDGKKIPLEWDVLEVADGKALLLSEKTFRLEAPVSYMTASYADWKMRNILNKTFYKDAFNKDEQAQILETTLKTEAYDLHLKKKSNHQEYPLETKERVFLLSLEEIQKYLDVKLSSSKGNAKLTKHPFLCSYKEKNNPTLYWVRSALEGYEFAMFAIEANGRISHNKVTANGASVCPAIWISLDMK